MTNKYAKGRKMGRNVYRGVHQKELPSNKLSTDRKTLPRKTKMFEDGTG
jgi:hypothetical protein